MSKLDLYLGGQQLKFDSITATFSIEQLAHTFSVTCQSFPIKSSEPVEIKLSGKTIFAGQLDSRSRSLGPSSNKMTIAGRSLSANLIDSKIKTDAIYGQTLPEITKKIVKDFGLGVENKTQNSPIIPEFQLNAESPVPGLAQAAKQQKLLLLERDKKIVIESPGQFSVTNLKLEEGKNLTDITINQAWSNLFYHYEVQGAWDGAEAIVKYEGANTCRQKVIISDKLQDETSCKLRAEYERDLAIAKGLTVSGTIPGIHPELTYDAINKLIQIEIPSDRIKEQMLIKSISLTEASTSINTQIELMRPFHD